MVMKQSRYGKIWDGSRLWFYLMDFKATGQEVPDYIINFKAAGQEVPGYIMNFKAAGQEVPGYIMNFKATFKWRDWEIST